MSTAMLEAELEQHADIGRTLYLPVLPDDANVDSPRGLLDLSALDLSMGAASSSRVWFRNGWTCGCVATSLPWVELALLLAGRIRNNVDIFQLGYNGTAVAASAGTHAGGGCTDVGQFATADIAIWRKWGWTIQKRYSPPFSGEHGHGWPWGCTHLSSGAEVQENEWRARQDGLVGSGSVAGPWPVNTWKTALERNRMAILDDIQNACERAVLDALNTDDALKNDNGAGPLTGNADNTGISYKTAIANIANRTITLKGQLDNRAAESARIEERLERIESAVAKLSAA